MISIKSFNSSYNIIKLILPCGESQLSNNLLTNFLVENYNFLNYKDFFQDFSRLTFFLRKYNLLLRVLLYLPDSKSEDNQYYFFIKSFESSFFLKNFLFNQDSFDKKYNNTMNLILHIDFLNLIKINLILFLLNQLFFDFKINLIHFRSFFQSFIGYINSFQFIFLTINGFLTLINKKNFIIKNY